MQEANESYQIRDIAFSCDDAKDQLQKRVSNGLKIIITDACRDEFQIYKHDGNPLDWNVNYNPQQHKPLDAKGFSGPKNTNIIRMCATSRGKKAAAGRGASLSVYTKSLSENMRRGENIYQLNENLSRDLRDKSQVPTYEIEGGEDFSNFFFLPSIVENATRF